jgi:hypothetical protein
VALPRLVQQSTAKLVAVVLHLLHLQFKMVVNQLRQRLAVVAEQIQQVALEQRLTQVVQLLEHLFKAEMVVQFQEPKVVLVVAVVTSVAVAVPTKLQHLEHLMVVAEVVLVS